MSLNCGHWTCVHRRTEISKYLFLFYYLKFQWINKINTPQSTRQSGKKRETAESYLEESVWVGKQANPVHSFPTISITILFLPFCFIFHPDIFNTTFKGHTAFAVLLIL